MSETASVQFVRADGAVTMPVTVHPPRGEHSCLVTLRREGDIHPWQYIRVLMGEKKIIQWPPECTHWECTDPESSVRARPRWWKPVE